MKLSLAKIISAFFNPVVLISVAPFYMIYVTTKNIGLSLHWTLYTMCFVMAILAFIIIGVKKKIFSDLDISTREQRKLIYLVGLTLCVIYFFSIIVLTAPTILYIITLVSIVLAVVLGIINRYIKASLHLTIATALFSEMALNSGKYYYVLLLLIPLIGWARLKTKRHTLSEVKVGATLGVFVAISIYIAEKIFLYK